MGPPARFEGAAHARFSRTAHDNTERLILEHRVSMGASKRKAIVLGGYGLIGRACMRALANAGFEVVGVGRSSRAALAADANATWLIRDIPTISVDEWRVLLGMSMS